VDLRRQAEGRGRGGRFQLIRRVVVVLVGLVLASCSRDVSPSPQADVSRAAIPPVETSAGSRPTTTLAQAGTRSEQGLAPVANVDHWHAAYGIYDCDRYLAPIDGSAFPDPSGIHTHDDGLIHIHPFADGASGSNATLQVFFDFLGVDLTDDRLRVETPVNTVMDRRNGDVCPDGRRGRVRVLEFPAPTHSNPVEVRQPGRLRLQRDQVIAIVFAPDDRLVGPPPSMSELDDPADMPVEFELTPDRQALIGPQPAVEFPPERPAELSISDIEIGKGEEVGEASKVGVKFVLATWSARRTVESNWEDTAPLLGLAMGRDSVVKGFEQGMQGMRVGGLRRIVIPPELGFGTLGSPPMIGPNETLVLYVRLVAIEAPRFATRGTTLPA
jgi:peptidylprolyl isomerase